MKTFHVTHEHFIQSVRDAALQYASTVTGRDEQGDATALHGAQLQALARAKLLYGRGHSRIRGVTQFGAWVNGQAPDELIEVCAAAEESWIQLAGTTIHELGHVAAGFGEGHSKVWKQACAALGLRRIKAAGTVYRLANFAPELRERLARLPKPMDGTPRINGLDISGLPTVAARPCSHGVGSRGGTSRGPGSGSRLRKYVCPHGQIVRASTDALRAACLVCGGNFSRVV